MNNSINFYEELQLNKYKPGFIPDKEQILFQINNNTIGSIQSYAVISGLPKSGKSTFVSSIVASSFIEDDIFGMKLKTLPQRGRVCYIDTESSQHDFYSHMTRIKNLAKLTELPNTFDAFCLRKEDPGTIKKMIDSYLNQTPDCSIVIIDGLLDLCLDFNDIVECRMIVNWLKNITTVHNLFLLGILHTGKRDGQTLGHLGSNTDRWSQSTLEVKKDDQGNFELSPKFLRSSKNFTPIKIRYDDFEMQFVQVDQEIKQFEKQKDFSKYLKHEHDHILNQVFKDQYSYSYDDLIKIISKIDKRGINSTKQYIKYLKEKMVIQRNNDGLYNDNRISF
jgi:hypothetical protein